MKLTFRQGVVSHQTSGFLFSSGGNIDLRAADRPVIVTVAHKGTDYVFTEDESVTSAWPGPFDSTKNYWLYWDFDLSQFGGACPPNNGSSFTCKRTFGRTERQPISTGIEPANPQAGQMWYDTSNFQHFEWNGTNWVEKLRVFAAWIQNGGSIITPLGSLAPGSTIPSFIGTQIGDYSNVLGGRPLYTELGVTIQRDDGTLLTTEDQFFADKTRVDAIRLESNVSRAQSMANALDAFSIVAYDQTGQPPTAEAGRIRACTYNDVESTVIGLLTEQLLIGEVGAVIIEGVVSNSAWNWMTGDLLSVGDLLWVDNGVLVSTNPHVDDPSTYTLNRPAVARVLSNDTIVFQQGLAGVLEVDTSNDTVVPPATVNTLGISRLSVPAGSAGTPMTTGSTDEQPIVVETTDPRMSDRRKPKTHYHGASTVTFDPSSVSFTIEANVQDALEDVDSEFLRLSGGVMTGFITLNSDPLANLHPATKQYVDRLTSDYTWIDPVSFANLISITNINMPPDPAVYDVYVVPGILGDWGEPSGSVMQYYGLVTGWVKIANSLSDFPYRRFGVAFDSDSVPGALTKNTIVDHTGSEVYDPYPVSIPPSPAVSVAGNDFPLGMVNPNALSAYAWNGSRWIKTQGTTSSFGNWITGNQGSSYTVDPQSYDLNSTSIGNAAESDGANSLAIGTNSQAQASNSIAIGTKSDAQDDYAVSIGPYTLASGANSIAIGANVSAATVTRASEADAIAIGTDSTADYTKAVVIGNDLDAINSYQVLIGSSVSNISIDEGILSLTGNNAQVVIPKPYGTPAEVTNPQDGALIYTTDGRIWLFNGSYSPGGWEHVNITKNWFNGNNDAAFVTDPTAAGDNAIAGGDSAITQSDDSLVLGTSAVIGTGADNAIAIGNQALVGNSARNAIVIGTLAGGAILGESTISIGELASAIEVNDIAIGTNAYSIGDSGARSAIAIGDNTMAGADSVVIGSDSKGADGSPETPVDNVTIVGSKSSSNRENTVVIGDEVSIDTTNVGSPLSAFPYAGEFVKIGTSAGTEMFLMMVGDPSALGGQTGGHLILRAPHAQYVLPKYNPKDYDGVTMGLPAVDQMLLPEEIESRQGGIIYDLESTKEYDAYSSPKGPGAATEPRVKVFNGFEWVVVGAEYLDELKDVNIDYTDMSRPADGMTLTYRDGIWYPDRGAIDYNDGNELTIHPTASAVNALAIGNNTGALEVDAIAMGSNVVASEVSSIAIGTDNVNDLADAIVIGTDLTLPNVPSPLTKCTNFTTVIGRGGAGVESYLSIGETGQLSVHGDDAQIVLPTHYEAGTPPLHNADGCEGGMIWDEVNKKAFVWDGLQWVPLGAGGGGVFEVEIGDIDMPGAPDDTDIGTPMYFRPIGSPPTGGVWAPARSNAVETIHTCVISDIGALKVTMMVVGEVTDVDPSVNNGFALAPGWFYYLSEHADGQVSVVPGTENVAPVWQALSPTSALVLPYRASKTSDETAIILGLKERNEWSYALGNLPMDYQTFAFNYTPGQIDVYVNGILLDLSEYSADNAFEFILASPLMNPTDDVVTAFASKSSSTSSALVRHSQEYDDVAGETDFIITSFTAPMGNLNVYVNGSKLTSADYTQVSPILFQLTDAISLSTDIVEAEAWDLS